MNKVALRGYQADAKAGIAQAFRRVKRVLLQVPTGGGKTCIASAILEGAQAKGRRALFVVHRNQLLEQSSLTFTKYGLPHSFIAAGYPYDPTAQLVIASVDTLHARLDSIDLSGFSLVIFDEAHHQVARTRTKVQERLAHAYQLGLSATPIAANGAGLCKNFDEMVLGPSVAWLIEQGYLSQYRIFAPYQPDLSSVKSLGGDYNVSQLAEATDRPKLVGDVVASYQKYALGLRTLAFAVNVQHSKHLAAAFNAAGIGAAHLDADTPKEERANIVKRMVLGEISVITVCMLATEGWDLSALAQCELTIDCVVLARPTQSLALHLQMLGRGLRPALGKVCIIIDHAANVARLGFPDDDFEWSLTGSAKGKKKDATEGPPPPITCEGCYQQLRRPAPLRCPYCDHELFTPPELPKFTPGQLQEIKRAEKLAAKAEKDAARTAKHEAEAAAKAARARVKADKAEAKRLAEIERERLAELRKAEERACKSFEDFVELGKRRCYDYPLQWAEMRSFSRGYKTSRTAGYATTA